MIGTNSDGGHLAEIRQFRLQAFDVEADDAAAGENQRYDTGGASDWANSTARRFSSVFLLV
jgi:hypothetical protein